MHEEKVGFGIFRIYVESEFTYFDNGKDSVLLRNDLSNNFRNFFKQFLKLLLGKAEFAGAKGISCNKLKRRRTTHFREMNYITTSLCLKRFLKSFLHVKELAWGCVSQLAENGTDHFCATFRTLNMKGIS